MSNDEACNFANQRWIPDAAALAVVAGATAASVCAMNGLKVLDSVLVAGLIAVLVLVGIALYVWYVSEGGRKADSDKWKAGTIFTPFLGTMFFAIDVFIGSSSGHYDSFIQAALHAGGPFGIVLTVLTCPVATIICLGSWVRSSLLERTKPLSDAGN